MASRFDFQIDLAENFVDARRDRRWIHFVSVREVIEIFPNFQVVVEGKEVGEIADVLLRVLGMFFDVDAIDGDAARCRLDQPADHF